MLFTDLYSKHMFQQHLLRKSDVSLLSRSYGTYVIIKKGTKRKRTWIFKAQYKT